MGDKFDEVIDENSNVKIKKWDHIPVRPETFALLRGLKRIREDKFNKKYSDNAFVLLLIKAYNKVIGELNV